MSERVPEPLEMSDTEILDWMNEYSDGSFRAPLGGWFIDSLKNVYGASIREAVRLAAAYDKEANLDF